MTNKKATKTIGIIGGGQLGKMIAIAAIQMGYRVVVFSDKAGEPATQNCLNVVIADYRDQRALKKFAEMVDIATFEFENIPYESADFIAGLKPLYPSPKILKITQNRLLEKNFLNSIKVKTTDYLEINSLSDLQEGYKKFGPSVLKTANMGYDGKGQAIIKSSSHIPNIYNQLKGNPLILEKFCKYSSEASVIVARSFDGQIKTYEPLTNIHKNAILDQSIYPAKISKELAKRSQGIAKKIATYLDLVGVLAVEFFVMGNGDVLVNELAPRPHNSGHFSMNACDTSQFEQLIRAINGVKLGSTRFHSSGYMQNIIGDQIHKLEKYYQNPKAKIHLYGKEEVLPGRKMGHINIIK